jgi:hypothetical protein
VSGPEVVNESGTPASNSVTASEWSLASIGAVQRQQRLEAMQASRLVGNLRLLTALRRLDDSVLMEADGRPVEKRKSVASCWIQEGNPIRANAALSP